MNTNVNHKEFWPSIWLFPYEVSDSPLSTQLPCTDIKKKNIHIFHFNPSVLSKHLSNTLSVMWKCNRIFWPFWQQAFPAGDPESLWCATEKQLHSANAVIMPVNSSLRRRVTFVSQQYDCQWDYVTATLNKRHMQTCMNFHKGLLQRTSQGGLDCMTFLIMSEMWVNTPRFQ